MLRRLMLLKQLCLRSALLEQAGEAWKRFPGLLALMLTSCKSERKPAKSSGGDSNGTSAQLRRVCDERLVVKEDTGEACQVAGEALSDLGVTHNGMSEF